MPNVYETLTRIAAARSRDPLAPVTFVTPSHASSIQLRRFMAELGPFAAVRFETLPRLAELIGAARLAAVGRSPLARPIGDYLAIEVGRQARGVLAGVADLPGFARVLRQVFRRLRRAGIRSSADVTGIDLGAQTREVLRLYDLFREASGAFYDEEDLLDSATEAVTSGDQGIVADFGEIFVVPPGALTAAGNALLDAIAVSAHKPAALDDPALRPEQRFVVAPDPACEAREVVRLAIGALERGVALHELAVFHGADASYGRLLRDAARSSDVPIVPLPGVPLIETRAGRAALWLAELPQSGYSRAAVMDFLAAAPSVRSIPAQSGPLPPDVAAWDRVSREAGVTRGAEVWEARLKALAADRRQDMEALKDSDREYMIPVVEREADDAERLASVVRAMVEALEPLRTPQPAASFIEAFKSVVNAYIDSAAPGMDEVQTEIEQLGTVGAVGGSFHLDGFAAALRANLEAAHLRPRTLGDGVVVADHRIAAGLRFREVILCGAFEGAVPAGPGMDSLVDDGAWVALKHRFPHIEDKATRLRRARDAVERVIGAAGGGLLTWSCPAYEQGGTREYYPSPVLTREFALATGQRARSAHLRAGVISGSHLRRSLSPYATVFRGPVVDPGELAVRLTAHLVASNQTFGSHPKSVAARMLRARRSTDFTIWDGNLSELAGSDWMGLQSRVSPTSLQHYAGCGFAYLCRSLLKLEAVDEPEEREEMDPLERGSLIHNVLEQFFKAQRAQGRPAVGEAWTADDERLLIDIAAEHLDTARIRGLTGLDIFADHESRTIFTDLRLFLAEDTAFRQETGAVPVALEADIPEDDVLPGVVLRGRVDRVDMTPDRRRAWVIDYKTGRSDTTKSTAEDPLAGGALLQLPAYVPAAGGASEVETLYWFITQRGGFTQISHRATPEFMHRFKRVVTAIAEGIRAGAFPAVPGDENEFYGGFSNCSYCEFDRICSRRRDLEFAAKEADPAVAWWRRVREIATGVPE